MFQMVIHLYEYKYFISISESEKKLVKDVKRYKSLLRDAQEAIERMKQDTTTKSAIKQLRDQVLC